MSCLFKSKRYIVWYGIRIEKAVRFFIFSIVQHLRQNVSTLRNILSSVCTKCNSWNIIHVHALHKKCIAIMNLFHFIFIFNRLCTLFTLRWHSQPNYKLNQSGKKYMDIIRRLTLCLLITTIVVFILRPVGPEGVLSSPSCAAAAAVSTAAASLICGMFDANAKFYYGRDLIRFWMKPIHHKIRE